MLVPLRPSNEATDAPSKLACFSLHRVTWSILDCARRTSTFRSCAFREQEDDQVARFPLAIPLALFCTHCFFYTPSMPPPSDLSFAESLSSEQRQNFYERQRFLAILMILVVLFSPFAGVYVTGLIGAGIGVLLSIAAYYLTPYVWLKIGG